MEEVSPPQDPAFNSNNISHLQPTVRHDCIYSLHLAVLIPSNLQHNEEEDMVADYDDTSQIMDELYSSTRAPQSQHPLSNSSETSQFVNHIDST